MIDESTPSVTERIADMKTAVTDGVTEAATRLGDTIEEGRKPGNALDILSRFTRETPLVALAAAFLVGRFVGRRRR
jgi:hypothetical protein